MGSGGGSLCRNDTTDSDWVVNRAWRVYKVKINTVPLIRGFSPFAGRPGT